AAFNGPAVVQLEPDFWGFAQRAIGIDPTRQAVHVASLAPDCTGLPGNLAGMAQCLIKLARTYSPKVAVGFHVSSWGANSAGELVTFFNALGANNGDFITLDALDRDAGCFEAGNDPNCQGRGTTGFYWDESNLTSPNFHDHLAWAKSIHDGIGGLPL